MKIRFLIELLCIGAMSLAFVINVTPQRKTAFTNTMSLVESERAFARASIDKGTRAAFLEYLAEDSIVFHPGPVNGQKWWRDRPVRPGVLSWQPVFAFVSGSNDLGYTTGPWELRPKSLADSPVAYGNFVSVWKRQADGWWKVQLDIGSDNPAPKDAPVIKFAEDAHSNKKTRTALETESERNVLSWAEGEFVKALNSNASAASLMQYLTDDVRVFRMKAFPMIGKEAASVVFATRSGAISLRVAGTEISLAGDLGYTYGAYEIKNLQSGERKETGNYLRIWRRQSKGKWKLALDLLNPIPPPSAS